MRCKKCRIQMKQLRGTYHNKRKFRCPRCGAVRMQRQSLPRRVRDG